jgi:rhodanese-related sulfurtransferase
MLSSLVRLAALAAVAWVEEALKTPTPPALFDANGEDVRKEYGVIPGAKLLTDPSRYDVAATLPAAKDAPLVFYCAYQRCTSAESAAQRALAAGYTRVSVMPDGIRGWREAGRPTQSI